MPNQAPSVPEHIANTCALSSEQQIPTQSRHIPKLGFNNARNAEPDKQMFPSRFGSDGRFSKLVLNQPPSVPEHITKRDSIAPHPQARAQELRTRSAVRFLEDKMECTNLWDSQRWRRRPAGERDRPRS